MSGMLVVACSGDDQSATPAATPTADETVTPSPEETPVPTTEPTPSVDPTEALEDEITEFFEEYIEVSDKSWSSTASLEDRRDMFSDSCSICVNGYERTKESLEDGLEFVGDSGSVTDVSVTGQEGGAVTVVVEVDAPSAKLVDSNGEIVDEIGANPSSQVVYQLIKNESGEWMIIKGDVLQ